MNKTISVKYVIAIVAFFTAAAVAISAMMFQLLMPTDTPDIMPGQTADSQEIFLQDKLQEIKNLVDKYYIGDVDSELMTDTICAGYVAGLNDRYSGYVTAEDSEQSLNSLYGVNSGLGVQISMHPDNNTIYVLEVHDGSPAKEAGVLRGDEIVSVDGKVVAEFGYAETLSYIKTVPMGESVHLTINRAGKTVELSVTLNSYVNQSVFYRKVGDKGYIMITGFDNRSPDQFSAAVESLTDSGATALIIDLRGNGGGTLNAAHEMLDYCIPEGLAIKVEYKNNSMNEVYMSDAQEVDLPIVCLTDANTASASELFTQGLKDYGKAISVGRLTYGKGVVQKTFILSDGSLVRFTVGKYYTQNGTCLDSIGVAPDIEITLTEEEAKYRLVNGLEKDKDFIAACEYLDSQLS